MKYFIKRDLNEYGPYTLADLQRYVAQGNISKNDLTRSEGMTDWVPVSQVIGELPAPPPPSAPAAMPSPGETVYSGTPAAAGLAYGAAAAPAVAGPVPPDLQWPLVLLLGMVSCGMFNLVWIFIEAAFVKKLKPDSSHLTLIITGLSIQIGSIIIFYAGVIGLAAASAGRSSNEPPTGIILLVVLYWLGLLGGAVVNIIGNFKLRDAMVEYYNTVEPINLRMSGVMTFFFNILYFQHHLSRIATWKKTGYLAPQVYQG